MTRRRLYFSFQVIKTIGVVLMRDKIFYTVYKCNRMHIHALPALVGNN